MKPVITRISAFAMISALAACGGSSSTSTQVASTNGLPFSSGQTADLATLAAQGNIAVKASEAAYDGGSFSNSVQNLTLDVNSVNSIDFSFNGSNVTLTRAGGTGPFTGTLGGTNLSATVNTDTSIFFGQVTQTRGAATSDSETFFVTGFETAPANLPTSATYSGTAQVVARDRAGGPPAVAAGSATTILNGTSALTVDFTGAGLTAGSISGLDDQGNTLTLTLAPKSFAGQNNFSTTATSSGTSDITMTGVTVNGVFFGPAGEQVGGTINGNVTAGMPNGNPSAAAGFFEATR